jgi:hypothetical protein
LKEVVLHFMRTGERSNIVTWRDLREDAERPRRRERARRTKPRR